MPFDLGADISIEADVLEPIAITETPAEEGQCAETGRRGEMYVEEHMPELTHGEQ